MMTVRKMFALFTAVVMTACIFSMFGSSDASAAATAPDMARRPRHSTFVDKNRKTTEVAVAAVANMTAVTPVAVWTCPYDLVVLNVKFVQSGANGTHAPTPTTGVLDYVVNLHPDGGRAGTASATIAHKRFGALDAGNYVPLANDYAIFTLGSTRTCKAGDVIRFGSASFTAGDGTADFPAGILQIDYAMQDVAVYDNDGGLI